MAKSVAFDDLSGLSDEQQAVLKAFRDMDTDSDGELTAQEIFAALQRSGVEATLERVEEVVKLCDADGNGMVSAQEYVDAVHRKLVPQSWSTVTKFNPLMKSLSRRFTLKSHSVELKGEEIEELRRSFAAADLDQSGTLDQEEIYKVLSAHAKISEAQASKLMEDADADKSGALDFEEFLEVIATSRLKKNAGSWWRSWLPVFGEKAAALPPCEAFGSLSGDQTNFCRSVFVGMDSDGDGKVAPAEIVAALADLEIKAAAADAKQMIKDAGCAKFLTLEAFYEVMIAKRASTKRWQLWWVGWLQEGSGKVEKKVAIPDARSGLTGDQIKKYEAVFREIDEDRSGFIDKTEMQACLKRLGAKATAKEAARVLKVADLDGNGVLDFDEFLVAVSQSRPAGWNAIFRYVLKGPPKGPPPAAAPRERQGRTRERNSKLQSLISRPFSTRERRPSKAEKAPSRQSTPRAGGPDAPGRGDGDAKGRKSSAAKGRSTVKRRSKSRIGGAKVHAAADDDDDDSDGEATAAAAALSSRLSLLQRGGAALTIERRRAWRRRRGRPDDDDDDDAAAPGNDDARPVAVAAPAVPAKTAEETAIEIAHMVEIFEALDIGDAAGLTEIQAVKALESCAHLEGEPLEEFRAVVRAAPKDEDGLVAVAALARAVADAEAKPAFAALRATIARAVEVKTSEDASSDEEDLSPRDALNRETQALLHGDGTRSFASAGGGGMQVDLHSGFQFGDTFRLGPPKRRSAGTDGSLFTGHEKMRMDWILVMVLYDRREGGDAMPCHVKKLLKLLKVSGWRRNEDEWRAVVSALAVQGCIRATMSDAGQPYEVVWPSRRDDETKQAVEEAVHAHDADAGAEAKGS
ncbi:Ca2-binding protein [Aureococcus anophagefferens]|nr:Ca2-binding protein [Aureococcus anophagefferens]